MKMTRRRLAAEPAAAALGHMVATRPPSEDRRTALPPIRSDGDAGGATASPSDSEAYTSELRLLSRGSSFGFIGLAANAVLAFGFSLVVARLFHARGTGTFFEALAIFTIASNIVDLGADDGLSWAIPRLRAAGQSEDIRRLLPLACIPVLVLSSCLAVALFLNAGAIAHLFSHGHSISHLSSFIRILAPFVPVAALVEVLIPGTRGFDRVWPLVAIWLVVIPLLRLVLLPFLFHAGLGLHAIAYSWGVPIVLAALALLWVIWALAESERRQVLAAVPARPLPVLAKEFWAFSSPRALASICGMALIWMDVLLVGYIKSLQMAGVYGVASRYIVAVTFVIIAVGSSIAPQVSRLLSLGRLGDLRRLYQTATGWLMAVTWPVSFVMAVFATFFMRIFGADFASGHVALSILALMMLYVTATGNNMVILVMTGRTATTLWIGILSVAVNLGANLLLIPHLGIDGAAVAWAATLVVSNGITSLVLYRHYRLSPIGPAFLPVAGASACCIGLPALLARAALGAHWTAILVTAVVGGGAYLLVLWRIRDRLEIGALWQRARP